MCGSLNLKGGELKKKVKPPKVKYQGNPVPISFGKAMANANQANDTQLGQGLSPEKLKSLEKLVKGG